MSEAQRKAPEEQAERRQEAPRPQFAPPPVQQQDIRQVGAATDQRVQQALDHGARLEGRLPNPELEQRAQNMISWANQVRGVRVGDREYSAQADIVVQTANRALQEGDSALMDKALGQAMLLGIGVNAQWRGDTSGTPDGRAISESIQRGWSMFGTDQGTERLSYSVAGARTLEDSPQVFSSPENQDAKNGIMRAISRLADPSVSLRPDEVRSAYQFIQQSAAVAAVRAGGNELMRDMAAQMQIILASDTAREKLKDQVDKLIDSLGSALEKLSDSRKGKDEKEKEISELGEKTEKLAATALESALAEAGAPPELIAALKGSGKMLDSKAAAVRERGRQLLQLGITYLRNKELFMDKGLLGKLVSSASLVAEGKDRKKAADAVLSLQGAVGKALESLGKERAGKLKALDDASKALQGMLRQLEGDKDLGASVGRVMDSVQDAIRRLKGGGSIPAEYLRNLQQTMSGLKESLGWFLKMPRKERGDAGSLLASTLDSSMKGPASEITKLLGFMAGECRDSKDQEYRSFLSGLGAALAGGKMKAGEAISKLTERFLKDGGALESVLGKADPALAKAFSSILNALKGGKADTGMLARAARALGIGSFIRDRVMPQKEGKAKEGALRAAKKALASVKDGDFAGASEAMKLADGLLAAPPEKADPVADKFLSKMAEGDAKAKDALRYERKSLLEQMPSMPKPIQDRIAGLIGEADGLLKDGADGDAMASLMDRIGRLKKMAEEIRGMEDPQMKSDLAAVYSAAVDALGSGQDALFRTLMLASKELRESGGFDRQAQEYRKGILSGLKGAAEDGGAKLLSVIGEKVRARLDSARKGRDPEADAQLAIIASDLSAQPGAESIERARTAVDMARSMDSHLGRAGKDGPAGGAHPIYLRALSALASGGDLAVAGAQKYLAERYAEGQDEARRKDIEALSGRVAQDPGAMPDIETFININDQGAAIRKSAGSMPKGKTADSLNRIAGELDSARGRIARGEDIASDEEVQTRLAQLKQLYGQGGEVKDQVDSLAAELVSRSGGEIPAEDALAQAMEYSARSAAAVSAKERLGALASLSQLIAKAGPFPSEETASALGLALDAYLKGDMEKGAVFGRAAAAELENPTDAKKIAGVAAACDNGLSLDAGMLIISLHSADIRAQAGRISDAGMRANANSYLSLAEMAAWRGDLEGARAIAGIASSYISIAGTDERGLDAQGKKTRSSALSSIEAALGDYRKNPALSGLDPAKPLVGGKSAESLGLIAPAASAAFSGKPLREGLGKDAFRNLQGDAAGWSASSLLLAHSSDFDDLSGKTPWGSRSIEAGWEAEKSRLLSLAKNQRDSGNALLAEYYESEAAAADRSFMKDAIPKAKELLSKAASELDEAGKLKARADGLLSDAAAARKEGRDGDAGRMEAEAKGLMGQAGERKMESDRILSSVSALDESMTALDRSVRKVNSVNRERGRSELLRSARLSLAVGLGLKADSLGEMGTEPLDADSYLAQMRQAGTALASGKREVEIQESIMRTRDAGIASAKASLHDFNIQQARGLLEGLVDRAVGGDPDAKKTYMDSIDQEVKDGNVTALRDRYFQLTSSQGVKVAYNDADGVFKTAFDPVENEKRYQSVVGLYSGENFSAARALSRSARFDMESGAQIANIFLQGRRLQDQYDAAFGPPKGPFAKAVGRWSSHELLKQIISRMPPERRKGLMENLDSIDRGVAGDDQRELMHDVLSRDILGGQIEQDIYNGRMGFYHEDALVDGVVGARKLAFSGDIGGAESLLSDNKEAFEKQSAMQEYDSERTSFDRLNYEYRVRAGRTKDLYVDVPGEAGEYDSGKEKKAALDAKRNAEAINRKLESPVDELKDGLLLRAKENDAASKRYLDARDSAERMGGKIRVDEGVIGALVSNMPAAAKGIHSLYDEAAREQDPAARAGKMQKVWKEICENNPQALVYAADRAAQDTSFQPDEVVQLKALAGGMLARSLNFEWDTSIEPIATRRIRRGTDFLRQKAGTKDEDSIRKLDELAKVSFGLANALSKNGYGWFNDPDRAKSILKNDRDMDEEDFKLVFKKSDFDQDTKDRTARELGEMKSDLELWLSGIRVGDGGKVERVRLSPAEYERVAKAYQAFLIMEDELRSNAGVGREDQQRMHMAHVFGRAYEFHRSAETVVERPEGTPRAEALEKSDSLFSAQGIYTDEKGRMKDVDLQTKIYRDAMRDWQAGVDLGLGALKLAGMGVAFAVGGPAAWIAGGIGAVEGIMGAADYYEACGGWDMMNTGEAGYFVFQLGLSAGSAIVPVMGSLAEARAAESMAAGLLEGTGAAAPGALETTTLWLGRGMVAGGLVQGGVGIYNYSDMVASGQMPLWAAIMHGGIDLFQSGVQPGLHAIRGARAGSTGLPTVRGRALQIGEMIFFGTPLDDAHAIRISYEEGLNRKAAENELSKLPPMERQSFAGYISENGLSPSRQLDLFVRYDEARNVNPDIAVKDFFAVNDRFTDATHPNGTFGDYVKNDMLRRSGALDAEEMKARNAAAKEARTEYESGTPIPRMEYRADEMERVAARLPAERRGEAVGLLRRAEAYRTEARRRQNEIDAGLRDAFSKRMDAVSAGGGVMLVPKMARPAEAYPQKNSAVAVELAVVADQVIRGKTDIGSGASRAVANLKKRGIEMDRGAVLDALSKLSQDREFIGGGELAESTRGEARASADTDAGRTTQIDRSLRIVSSMEGMEPPVAINQPPRQAARIEQDQAAVAPQSPQRGIPTGSSPSPPAPGKPPEPQAATGFSPTPLAGGGNPPAPPPAKPPPTAFSPTPLAGGGAGKPPEPPPPVQAQQSPQPGGGKRMESPAETRARAIATKANFDSAAKAMEAKFGPEAVRKFNPADPADPIYGFARASMEKSVNGDTLRPNEEAAVMFVVFRKMEAEEAAKLTESQAKERFMKSMSSQDNIAELARRIANGDKDAERSLSDLPPEMGAAIRSIAADKAFAAAAAKDDGSFAASWPKLYASRERLRGAFDTTRRALAPSKDDIIEVYRGTPDTPKRMETMRGFAALRPEDQQAVLETLRKEGRGIYALQLTELASLCGPDGLALELKFGLKPGELAQAYSQGFGFFEARQAIAQKLNIQADPIDSYAFGIITSGKLLQNLEGVYPGFTKVELKDIGGGATGAYKLKVTDASGDHVEFLKKVDMRPDKAGSENLLLAGVIAPEVLVADRMGNPFTYTSPEGEATGYGITRNISDYRGTLKIAGRDVTVKADRVVGIADLFQNPEMLGFFASDPQMFFEELGYSFAAQTAVGAIDGHGGNLFAGIYRIENPDPATLQALRDAGEHVLQYPNGDYALFKIARIDTDDSAGTYWAAPAAGGGFDFSRLSAWLGQQHVFPKLLASLARSMNEQELRSCGPYEFMVPYDRVASYRASRWDVTTDQFGRGHIVTYNPAEAAQLSGSGLPQIRAPSREPMFVSPRQVSRMVFGSSKDGPFYKGLERWTNSIGKDPAFKNRLKSNFRWNEGEPAGVSSFFPTLEMKNDLEKNGIAFNNLPNNGEERLPVFFKDGRTKMMADYERVDGASRWPDDVRNCFPQNQEVYVVEIPNGSGASLQAGLFTNNGKTIAVFSDRMLIPPDLRGREKAAIRHGDSVRAEPGFGDTVSVRVQKLGPARVLDYIMADPMKHFGQEFGDVQYIYEANEYQLEQKYLVNPADPAKANEFLSHRIPPGFGPGKLPH